MRLLQLLPSSILEEIFFRWIDMVDLAVLDMAICHRKSRELYLTILRNSSLAVVGLPLVDQPCDIFLNWIAQRGLTVEILAVICMADFLSLNNFRNIGDGLKQFRFEWGDLSRDFNSPHKPINPRGHLKVLHLPFLMKYELLPECFRLSDLEELDLATCFTTLSDPFLQILSAAPNIKRLYLNGCLFDNDILCQLPQYCPQLEFLQLSRAKISGQNPFMEWIHQRNAQGQLIFPHLKSIEADSCTGIDEDVLRELVMAFPTIEHWYLRAYSSPGILQAMGACLEQLMTLDLSHCSMDALVPVIDELRPLFQVFPALIKLNLSNCFVLTDRQIIAIVECCSELQELYIDYCSRITENGFVAIARCCPQLRIVSFANCDLLTDLALMLLIDNCPSLHTMILTSCLQITDTSVILLAEKISDQLRVLGLSNCQRVTEAGMFGILAGCRHLKKLDVSDNPWMNDQLFLKILSQLTRLRHLYLGYYQPYAQDVLQYLSEKKNLQIFHEELVL